MKKITLFSISLVLIFLSNICYSYDTLAIKMLPLQVGNKWVYNIESGGYFVMTVTGVTTVNSHIYYNIQFQNEALDSFICSRGPWHVYESKPVRVDSITGNVYLYPPPSPPCGSINEIKIDSLNLNTDYQPFNNCSGISYGYTDSATVFMYGQLRFEKNFVYTIPRRLQQRVYLEGIGIIRTERIEGFGNSCRLILKGCIINGVVYGDTTATGIDQINSEIPSEYNLKQNYPNPFNPETVINFSVPFKSDIYMKVYSINGKLLSESKFDNLQPGTYQYTWNGTGYPSGVYLYSISDEAGKFTRVKKMMLVK